MNLLLNIIIASCLFFNSNSDDLSINYQYPRNIDALILAYDEIYNYNNNHFVDKEPLRNFIILDMESIHFTDTTYEERQKAIKHFEEYGLIVLNASLFKLKEIGLANNLGSIKVDGYLLMITNISSNEAGETIVEGSKYHSPVGSYQYKVTLKVINNAWSVIDTNLISIA